MFSKVWPPHTEFLTLPSGTRHVIDNLWLDDLLASSCAAIVRAPAYVGVVMTLFNPARSLPRAWSIALRELFLMGPDPIKHIPGDFHDFIWGPNILA